LRENSDVHSQALHKTMPYWSDYLVRLGATLKKAGQARLGLNKPPGQRADEESRPGAGPHYRVRNPRGDRRMSPEQRRELLAQAVPPLQEMPYWSDYLDTLGSQVKQKTGRQHGWSAWTKQESAGAPVVAGESAVLGSIRRPIGDRRTRVRPRRVRDDGGEAVGNPAARSPRVNSAADPLAKYRSAGISLGVWGYYFIAKLGLFWMGLIAFHALENLVFAVFILLPAASLRKLKNIINPLLAVVLLYYDSWLPPVGRLISQASLLSDFSPAYLFELAGRFFNWSAVGLLFACSLVYWIVSRRIRVGVLVILGMVILGITQVLSVERDADKTVPDMNKVLGDFFTREAQRSVSFTTPQADAVPFDVIFIHVCSLSWDDVLAVGLEHHPLWGRFDILFKNFNSAASYSGPAAIHLLRSKCGQTQHGQMYEPVADKCYLMDSLKLSGFEPDVVLNHDGKFDNFLGQLQTDGRLTTPPMSLEGLDAAQYAFDKSPVYEDLSVLDRWLDTRQKSASSRVALYYNTISMHDGNHPSGTNSMPNTRDAYKARLSRFLDDLESFMQKLDKSGRRAVVVMVPEHGAALRGDKRQIDGLREIPTPAITIVPVGIKVVGAQREGEALSIDKSTSYLAITYIVERMLEQSPFAGKTFAPADYVANLPVTPFVAQNEKVTVAEYKNRFYYTRGDDKWENYSEFDKPVAKP
jgi:cellulose synthase operon protein YhjU